MNPTEEAYSDGVAFALANSRLWEVDAFVRGLRLDGRTFRSVEWDILCVRDDGDLLEAMEAKLGGGAGKQNALEKQVKQRVKSRLFNRVWALWEGEGPFRGGAAAGFGTLRLRPRPDVDAAVVELVERAPPLDGLNGEARRILTQKARAFTRPRRRLASGAPPVFMRCPACIRGVAYFYAHDYNERVDYISGDHAWFCEKAPGRGQKRHSWVNEIRIEREGMWVAGAHATRHVRL